MTKVSPELNIVEKIANYLNTYMVFPDSEPLEPGDQATACALWALHTWTFSESFPRAPWTTPYLFVNSETPRSGKTLLIDLLEPIVLNPERTIDMTNAVMYSLIEEVQPTLFIDEIDAASGQRRESIRGVMNGGYKHSGYVWRKVGQETKKYRTFSAKLIAGIYKEGLLDETVESRCIFVNLKRVATLDDEGNLLAPDGTRRQIYYSFLAEPEAEQLVREIQAFVSGWAARYEDYIPKPIPGISPRSWEIAMPLVQVARAIGIEAYAREVLARIFAPKPERDTPEVSMLRKIKEAFDTEGADRLFTETIVSYLGDGWNGKLLGKRLENLNLGKATGLTIQNKSLRGYYKHQFADVWREREIS